MSHNSIDTVKKIGEFISLQLHGTKLNHISYGPQWEGGRKNLMMDTAIGFIRFYEPVSCVATLKDSEGYERTISSSMDDLIDNFCFPCKKNSDISTETEARYNHLILEKFYIDIHNLSSNESIEWQEPLVHGEVKLSLSWNTLLPNYIRSKLIHITIHSVRAKIILAQECHFLLTTASS
jgi:hypothetical protein